MTSPDDGAIVNGMDIQRETTSLRERFGERPPGDEVLAVLARCDSDEERAAIEAAFIRETNNGPRPEDGPQE